MATIDASVLPTDQCQLEIDAFMDELIRQNPGQREFLQAVHDVVEYVMPVVLANPAYRHAKVLQRLVVPDRTIVFRVTWVDDNNEVQVNRGYRVQMNNLIGPYKGGLRFHPTANLGVLKFLAFEQVFKNALTTLPMGGGKGGSDFDPHGKSDGEVMRFCQAFMSELYRHIGPDIDVPAGDIGVGAREIGYLYGYYRKLTNRFNGVITGKAYNWGGSHLRPEATGYGAVYFAQEMLNHVGKSIEGMTATVSGSGNVAQYTIEKLNQLGARAITVSDSGGTIVDKQGIDEDKLDYIMDLKNNRRGRISEYADKFPAALYLPGQRPWSVPCDLAFPSATQNEIEEQDARDLISNGCVAVSEGANMPCTPDAQRLFLDAHILYGPGKAANAGGVAVSGLEMGQNASFTHRTRADIDADLHRIMHAIHRSCVKYGTEEDGSVNYVRGSNVAGFIKVADAMIDQGVY